jgi:hypothetical protein
LYDKTEHKTKQNRIEEIDKLYADYKPKTDSDEDRKFAELLNSYIYKEIKARIRDYNPEALSILADAKERLKTDLQFYKDTIKYVALALKPFYIICLVSILTQSPENV